MAMMLKRSWNAVVRAATADPLLFAMLGAVVALLAWLLVRSRLRYRRRDTYDEDYDKDDDDKKKDKKKKKDKDDDDDKKKKKKDDDKKDDDKKDDDEPPETSRPAPTWADKHNLYKCCIPTMGDNPVIPLDITGTKCRFHTRSQKWNGQWECSNGKWGNPNVPHDTGSQGSWGPVYERMQCAYTKECADKLRGIVYGEGKDRLPSDKPVVIYDDTLGDRNRDENAKKEFYELNTMIDLNAVGWNDKVSSIRVPSGYKVTLYRDGNGTGAPYSVVGNGEVKDLWLTPIHDEATSMKIEKA